MKPVPAWVPDADRLLAVATAKIGVLGATTPQNLGEELARLEAAASRGEPLKPRFVLAARPELRGVVADLRAFAARTATRSPLGRLYAERAEELLDEAALVLAAGEPGFAGLAERRFGPRDDCDVEAAELAAAWLAEAPPREPDEPLVRSDDEQDPRSLLCRLRAEVERLGLPFVVTPRRALSALAAVGETVIWVGEGRLLGERDTARTVAHEIEAHALPRTRARRAPLGLFTVGTARGSDDQEGRAVAIEERGGHLTPSRRRELGLRHVAALAVHDGASFDDLVTLARSHGADAPRALRVAARASRGGGLGRERVYLPAYLRFLAASRRDPRVEAVLVMGRVRIEAVGELAEWLPSPPPG